MKKRRCADCGRMYPVPPISSRQASVGVHLCDKCAEEASRRINEFLSDNTSSEEKEGTE